MYQQQNISAFSTLLSHFYISRMSGLWIECVCNVTWPRKPERTWPARQERVPTSMVCLWREPVGTCRLVWLEKPGLRNWHHQCQWSLSRPFLSIGWIAGLFTSALSTRQNPVVRPSFGHSTSSLRRSQANGS